MKISVIFCTYNSKHFPKLALEALERSKFNGEMEVIFVDNHSSDRVSLDFMEEAVRQGRAKMIANERNLGFGAANNLGVKIATGELILFHNPDVTVMEDSIQKLVDYYEKNKDSVGLVAPKVVYANGQVQDNFRREMKFRDLVLKRTPLSTSWPFKKRMDWLLMKDKLGETEPFEVDWVTGAMMLISKKFFSEVGGFDERYFLFMEDFDLCKAVRKKDFKVVYYPKSVVFHCHKRLSQGKMVRLLFSKVFWTHLVSAGKYFWKWK